jgi:hypothetical protein
MPFDLTVPYTDKDLVKNHGALWIAERKTWIIPDHIQDINPFSSWMQTGEGCIVRKPYLICLSKTNCWKCAKETPLIALAAKNYFFSEELSWVKARQPTLFSDVLILDDYIVELLYKHYPFFKKTYSYTAQETYHANTCVECGKLQGDFHHHSEPGGAFCPTPYDKKPVMPFFKTLPLEKDYYINAAYGGMAYDAIKFSI